MASSASASAAIAAIPRFLLPRRSPLWQEVSASSSSVRLLLPRTARSPLSSGAALRQVRYASTRPAGKGAAAAAAGKAAAPKPKPSNILEKPAKFNPPSHGARLPRKGAGRAAPASQHYGGDLSEAERQAQRLRSYPGMMAPSGTWEHWFWNSRKFHMTITMTALAALAFYTFLENFRRTSPFVDMLPTWSEAAAHPIDAVRTTVECMKLTENHRVAEIAERRRQRVDDVAKRTMYRKAHGMEETVGFASGWLSGGKKKEEGPTPPARNEEEPAAVPVVVDDASPIRGAMPPAESESAADAGKRKKFLGVF